jgi:hypothetical protein
MGQIQDLINAASSGSTINIPAGTYAEQIVINKPLTISGNGATINGSSITFSTHTDSDTSALLSIASDNVTINNLNVVYSDFIGVRCSNRKNITLNGLNVDHSRVSGLLFRGNTVTPQNIKVTNGNFTYIQYDPYKYGGQFHESLDFIQCNGLEFSYNKVHHTGMETIICKEGGANIKIHHNEIGPESSTGVSIDGGWNHNQVGITGVDIYNNYFHDDNVSYPYHVGIGLSVEPYCNPGEEINACRTRVLQDYPYNGSIENVQIYNNIIANYSYEGIGLAHWYNVGPAKNIICKNNTIYYCGYNPTSGGSGIVLDNGWIENVLIENNIVFDCNLAQIHAQSSSGVVRPGAIVNTNLIYPFRGTLKYTNGVIKESKGTNPVEADPQFVNAVAYDFHLQASSPAIDSGTLAGSPVTDFDGNPRPQAAAIDLGALEYTQAPQPQGELVAKYNLNESDGVSIIDLSGKGNHGLVINAAVSDNYGLSLNGINSYCDIPNSVSLDASKTNQVSVLLEMRLTAYPANQNYDWVYLMAKALSGNNRDYYILIERSTGTCITGFTVAGIHYSVRSTTVFNNLNTNYYIAYTYSQASGLMKLYVNGNLEAQAPYSVGIPYYSTNLQIGRFDSTYGGYVKADIRRMSVYTKELTQAEIQAEVCPSPICTIQVSS